MQSRKKWKHRYYKERKAYKELKERNIYLVNERKKLEELLFMSNENYIEKSLIKEKIEELEHKGENYIFNEKDNAVRLGKIQVLEELLGEEK